MGMNIVQKDIVVPGLYPVHGVPRRVGLTEAFVISAAAPACAVVFTNPFDTAKYVI